MNKVIESSYGDREVRIKSAYGGDLELSVKNLTRGGDEFAYIPKQGAAQLIEAILEVYPDLTPPVRTPISEQFAKLPIGATFELVSARTGQSDPAGKRRTKVSEEKYYSHLTGELHYVSELLNINDIKEVSA